MILIEDKIYVSKQILTFEQQRQIREDLTIINPIWEKAVQLELSPFGKIKHLTFYEETTDTFLLPFGYVNTLLLNWTNKTRPTYIDNRFVSTELLDINFTGKLYDFQQRACDEAMAHSFGIIQAPTGAGKSVMISYLIANRKQPTLILVNQVELGNQMVEMLKKFTSLKEDQIGYVGDNKFEIRPVTVALLQSMHNLSEGYYKVLNNAVGQVFCDEVHIVAADTYYETMSHLRAKYKFGFSATPKRGDGLTPVIFWATGPIIHSIPIDDVPIIMKPTITPVETQYYFPLISVREYSDMITDLSIDGPRNKLIVDTMTKPEFVDKQKLLLCVRILQVMELHKSIPGSDVLISQISKADKTFLKNLYGEEQVKLLCKKASRKHRRAIIADLNSGKLKTIIATYGLFHQGIDIQGLEVLGFCAPIKSEVIIKQCRGRIMRKKDGKSPLVIDFIDSKVELLKYQARELQRILKDYT